MRPATGKMIRVLAGWLLAGWLVCSHSAVALTNFAAQANGGVASASSSSTHGQPYRANDGDRKGTPFYAHDADWPGVWSSSVGASLPAWLQITFNATAAITEIDVFTEQDSWDSPSNPTPGMTFSLYGITAFDVQYWNGSAWVDVPGGAVGGNRLVWTKFTFPAITTDRIRVSVSGVSRSAQGQAAIAELEAWGVPAVVGPQAYYIEPDQLNTPRMISNQAGTTVWRWDQGEPFGNDVPNNNPSGASAFDFPLRFAGQYFDRETGLAYNYFRDYDPAIGRYIQSDPLGLKGGSNTYLYAKADPLRRTDPTGQGPLSFTACVIASYGATAYSVIEAMKILVESVSLLEDQLRRVNDRLAHCSPADKEFQELDKIRRDLERVLLETISARVPILESGLMDLGYSTVAFGACSLLLASPTP
jgi:RHS repeat-associated protein